MIKDKESWQAEELSLCLDALQEGRQSVSQDQEVQELIELAAIIQQAGNQAVVPDILIAEMADVLAIELGEKKQKRRKQWLYGGLAGTAAACFIAAFMQFAVVPHSENYMAQQQNNRPEMQNFNPSVPSGQPTQEVTSEKDLQQDGHIQQSEPNQEPPKSASQQLIAEILPQSEVMDQEKPSDQLALLQQPSSDVNTRQSALMARTAVIEEQSNQTEQKISTMLVIPDRKPQSVMIDPDGSVIEQVYHFGSQDEILITQRFHASSETAENIQQSKVQPFAKQNQEQPNRITIKIDQYDITVSGKRTPAELQKIAETLIEKKMIQ
ncbi:hypothetical protein SPFL3102_00970 [Sporomusaceae bacterium FL31]|nr:hypothetical protein SPFL3101_03021 [Sporomusaceae bacterium FL31]GCE33169.1 hypothetical protein SPFL3102_00970 [Sporomusaceae bacterium]